MRRAIRLRERRRQSSLMHRYCAQLESIVDRRRAEEALTAAKVSAEMAAAAATEAMLAAQSSDRAKSEFLATMSHELRTPLHGIIGFSQLISEETLGDIGTPQYREYAEDIHSSARSLLEIINAVLDLARIDSGMLSLEEEWFEAAVVSEFCLGHIAEQAKQSGLSVSLSVEPSSLLLLGDERRFRQILGNLLSNAIKFSKPGGAISVAWKPMPDGQLRLCVSDTGIGISRDDQARIFEPFTQADAKLDRQFEGAGLGLPLVRGLAKLHDGSTSIESDVGKGAAIHIDFPPHRFRTAHGASQDKEPAT